MEITKELVNYVARLSHIKLTPEEEQKMEKELGAVIAYMDVLNDLDTTGKEPLSHVFDIDNVMRADEVRPSYDREALLSNAPEHTDETVVVPKTVD
ncbi:MAG: Asp-tRNA(Asn)/Glu-tRNA(Gln) amidotransferase subunit GatC [Clostridiales bacterium]|nr:Asp-tRNA(Asn)/Glu-tRNA(Gln) amidotransferase subunit GatC [Clostridiales bacterium]